MLLSLFKPCDSLTMSSNIRYVTEISIRKTKSEMSLTAVLALVARLHGLVATMSMMETSTTNSRESSTNCAMKSCFCVSKYSYWHSVSHTMFVKYVS